jgi:hypothetical protein
VLAEVHVVPSAVVDEEDEEDDDVDAVDAVGLSKTRYMASKTMITIIAISDAVILQNVIFNMKK